MAKGMYVGQSINVGSVYILEYVEDTSKSVKFDPMDRNPFPVVVWDNSSLTDAGKIKLKTSEANSYTSIQSLNKGNTIGEVGQYLYSPAAFDNSDTTVKYIYCIISGVTNKDTLTFDFELKKYKVASEVAETKQVARKVKKMYVGSPASAYTAASIRLKNPQNVEKEIVVRDAVSSYYWSALSNGQLVKTDRQSFIGSDLASNITMLNGKYVLFDVDPDHIYYVQSTTDTPSQRAGDITWDPETTIAITGTMYDIEAGVAYKVKKGYVGIGGVARPFFGGGGLPTYYGHVTNPSTARFNMSGVTIGNKAVFAGGVESSSYHGSTASKAIDVYDSSLVLTTSYLGTAKQCMAGVGTKDGWALLAGGKTRDVNSQTCTDVVQKLDASLALTTATSGLAYGVYDAGAGTVGGYALVAGGHTNTSRGQRPEVYAYDSALTRLQVSSLKANNSQVSGCSLDNMVIFAGGVTETNVVAYNASLTQTVSSQTYYYRHPAAAPLGEKAIFAGGADSNNSYQSAVYVCDSSLTVTAASQSLTKANAPAGIAFDGYVAFGYGYTGSTMSPWRCDIFDESMTMTHIDDGDSHGNLVQSAAEIVSAAKAGNYAIFAGTFVSYTHALFQD